MSSPCSVLYVRHIRVCSPMEVSLSFASPGSSSAARPAVSPQAGFSPLTLAATLAVGHSMLTWTPCWDLAVPKCRAPQLPS